MSIGYQNSTYSLVSHIYGCMFGYYASIMYDMLL